MRVNYEEYIIIFQTIQKPGNGLNRDRQMVV